MPSWPLIVGLAFFIRALAQPMALLNDPDTYLHIATGRWMLAHMALPVHDPFSYSLSGTTWVPHEWLAEIVLAAVYGLAGWSGPVLLTAAAFAASLALLARFLLRSAEPFSTLIAAALGGALVLGHLLVRPHLLALPLLVLWSRALLVARDTGSGPPFRLLLVMALWANLHGSFMFGLALAAFLAAEAMLAPERRAHEARRWAGFSLLAFAAALLTPIGMAGFFEPLRLMAMPALQESFGEWLSPNSKHFNRSKFGSLGSSPSASRSASGCRCRGCCCCWRCATWRSAMLGTPSSSASSGRSPSPLRSARQSPPGSGRCRSRRSAAVPYGSPSRPRRRR